MKRYRVLFFSFDTRASVLRMEINETWDATVKAIHLENKRKIHTGLLEEFGALNAERKIRNFMDIGPEPFSVIAFHNNFLRQIRRSFVIGSYYPALTGACALGERILNHLVIRVREHFKKTAHYKKIYQKKSVDNWDLLIDILKSWGVLLPDVVDSFRRLK